MSDTYVSVRAILRHVRDSSVLVSAIDKIRHEAWLPRSVIHGGDEMRPDGAQVDREITFKVCAWKAREAGLA